MLTHFKITEIIPIYKGCERSQFTIDPGHSFQNLINFVKQLFLGLSTKLKEISECDLGRGLGSAGALTIFLNMLILVTQL